MARIKPKERQGKETDLEALSYNMIMGGRKTV
jgi:hypothetical protein